MNSTKSETPETRHPCPCCCWAHLQTPLNLRVWFVFCLFGCSVQVTSSARVSSSLRRGFWSMPAAWASPSSSGSSVEASVPWAHCATPSWASPSPNLGEITPTWRKSSGDWWGTMDFFFVRNSFKWWDTSQTVCQATTTTKKKTLEVRCSGVNIRGQAQDGIYNKKHMVWEIVAQ